MDLQKFGWLSKDAGLGKFHSPFQKNKEFRSVIKIKSYSTVTKYMVI